MGKSKVAPTDKLKIMCTGEIEVDFHELKDLQLTDSGKSLKATSQEKIDKLALSLKDYGIVNNLQVWIDDEAIYCFDAHHRKKAFAQLEKEGMIIPLLPATRCLAKNIKEAKRLLLLKESSNSWIDLDVVQDFLADIDFDIKEARDLIEIPDFDWPDEFSLTTIKNKEFIDKYTKTPDQGEEKRSDSTDELTKIIIWLPKKTVRETTENFNRRGIRYEVV